MSDINGAEWVGPPDAREDVGDVPDRALILRAIHEVLTMRWDMGAIMRELGAAAEDRKRTRALVGTLETRLDATQDEMREKTVSKHDLSEAAHEAAEITARHNVEELRHELTKEELDKLQRSREAVTKFTYTVIGGVMVLVIFGILAFVAGRLVH